MSMSRAVLLVSVVYSVAKIPLWAFCYVSREIVWDMASPILISTWLLPVVVLVGTMVWQWQSRDFRWLSLIVFIVWMAGLAFAETILWAYLRFGPTGQISPI